MAPTAWDSIASALAGLDRQAVPLEGRRPAAAAVAIVDDGGETTVAAALRELKEELGVRCAEEDVLACSTTTPRVPGT